MDVNQIEYVIDRLMFIRSLLYNGVYGAQTVPALTDAIELLRELKSIKAALGEQQIIEGW